jgi:hypothetical protein
VHAPRRRVMGTPHLPDGTARMVLNEVVPCGHERNSGIGIRARIRQRCDARGLGQIMPRRYAFAVFFGNRICSSSINVYPPGPDRHVSSPVFTSPFGFSASGSHFTFNDHRPESASVKLRMSLAGGWTPSLDWLNAAALKATEVARNIASRPEFIFTFIKDCDFT